MRLILILPSILISCSFYPQVGIGTTNPSPSAMLEIKSQTDGGGRYGGLMPPRVPDEHARNSINPTLDDAGLLVFVQNINALQIWNGLGWETLHRNEMSSYASDLFISEYVEGTGNNKAIEIANFTGASKNLSEYRLFVSYNEGNTTSRIALPNTFLNHGEVFIVAHEDASSQIISDLRVTNLNFNGDDAVILQTSIGADIDVMGEVGTRWKFGEDVTLRRRPLHGPSTVYRPSSFEVFGVDDFSGLGFHFYYP